MSNDMESAGVHGAGEIVPVGARVQHAEFGEGRVVVSQPGAAKVKVRFGGQGNTLREEKVTRAELRVVSVPQDPVDDEVEARILEIVLGWKMHVARGERSRGVALREGFSYALDEVELMYRVAKSRENETLLAKLLLRKNTAINYVWRWCDRAGFSRRSDDLIKRQVAAIEARLGRDARGRWISVPASLQRFVRERS